MNETNDTAKISECSLEQVLKSGGDKYYVPLYQREYAWGKTEIGRLLNDLFVAFWNDVTRNYYLGSFVVRKNMDEQGQFELIDGQQRLITLSMLFALYLNEDNVEKVLRFKSRKEADGCIDACYGRQIASQLSEHKNDAFSAAIGEIVGFYPEIMDGNRTFSGEKREAMADVLSMQRNGVLFREYLLRKVILFRIELPTATDVNAYFEIMNSRGEQLKFHEIMKARLLAKLQLKCVNDASNGSYDELAPVFDDIWTACSHMNGYLGYNLHMCTKYSGRPEGSWTDLAEWAKYQKPVSNENGKTEEEQSVIVDFANFLMHVLKCYQKKYIPNSPVTVTLDERDMQVKYEALESDVDPVLFLDLLIRLRLRFDKYVVKAENDENGDVEAWQLAYVEKGKKSYYAVNTFADKPSARDLLISFESMLQVSFNTQRNKDWLQCVLELDDKVFDDCEVLLAELKEWARKRLEIFKGEKEKDGKDFYRLGLECSRFMLNLVDYLMWENYLDGFDVADFKVPNVFVFRYLNSVEHHHPQHDDQVQETWDPPKMVDDIGNLFLVYSSENSSMSNRQPQEKKQRYIHAHNNALPDNPKRNWMYAHTDNATGWTVADMQKLSQHVRKLLGKFLTSKAAKMDVYAD